VAAALLALLVVVQILATPRYSAVPYAPDSTVSAGARAVAQVLEQHGVEVRAVGTPQAAVRELEHAPGSATLLVVPGADMTAEQTAPLTPLTTTGTTRSGDEVTTVLAGPSPQVLEQLAPHVTVAGRPASAGLVAAGCDDPDAVAARTLASPGDGLTSDRPSDVACFVTDGGAAMVRSGTVTVLDSAAVLSNGLVDDAGDAALALRLLGSRPTLVWLTPDATLLAQQSDQAGAGEHRDGPAGLGYQWLVALLGALVLLVWWRAPRLGPLVAEPLPVVVRSDEVTLGRGRLYRRSRTAAHAAALLRAAAISRVAPHVGLRPHGGPDDVVRAVAGATGRDPAEVRDLFYGPPPTTSAGLATLTTRLDQLTRDVHRP